MSFSDITLPIALLVIVREGLLYHILLKWYVDRLCVDYIMLFGYLSVSVYVM